MATTTRKRRRQPQRLGPHPPGSDEAVRIVRAFVAQQERIRARGDEWAVALLKQQRRDRRRFV